MKKIIANILRISVITYAILHFTTISFDSYTLKLLLSIAGGSMFLFTLFYLSPRNFKIPIFILSTGILVLIISNNDVIGGIQSGFLLMREMVGLLIVIPLLGWVLREEPYVEDIMALFFQFIN